MSQKQRQRPAVEMHPPANANVEQPAEKSTPLHADTPPEQNAALEGAGGLVLNPQPSAPVPAQQPQKSQKCSDCCVKCTSNCPCSQDCVALYFAAAPASAQNNVCLACGNCITCGLCMALAGVVDCNSKFERSDLCFAGWMQFFTAFIGVGVVFAFLEGVAIMREDGVW